MGKIVDKWKEGNGGIGECGGSGEEDRSLGLRQERFLWCTFTIYGRFLIRLNSRSVFGLFLILIAGAIAGLASVPLEAISKRSLHYRVKHQLLNKCLSKSPLSFRCRSVGNDLVLEKESCWEIVAAFDKLDNNEKRLVISRLQDNLRKSQ